MSVEDYSKLYDGLKSWVAAKTQQAKNRDLPTSTGKLRKALDILGRVRSKEIPAKKRDVETLSEMHDKLEAHKKKHSSAEGVPADRNLSQLKAVRNTVNSL